ncbi:MAG: hypothetical protein WA960_00515 [Tunicatimonas sp.]
MQNTRVRNLFSTILGVGVVAGGLVLSSCEDEFTEQDAIRAQQETLAALEDQEAKNDAMAEAMQDSLNRIGAKINYTVTVAAAGQGSTTNGRTEAANSAEGATVTVVQAGKTYTETAGKGGVATFTGLLRGQATVTVEAEDHTTATYTTTLGSAGVEENSVGTLIPVFPLTVEAGATMVSGKAWAELDATNDMPEPATGAKVRATVAASTAIDSYKTFNTYGRIETVTYDGLVQEAEVGSDGNYSLIIPNGNGNAGTGFGSTVEFMPFVAKQKYVVLEDGKTMTVEKDVLFGDGSSSHIKTVASVFAEIEAPTGKAEGFAVKAELAKQALTLNNFKVTGGTDYQVGDVFELTADGTNVATINVTTVDGDGAITQFTYTGNSAAFAEKPAVTAKTVNGTGAAWSVIEFTPYYDIVIDNVGSGYWTEPEVSIVYTNKQSGTQAPTIMEAGDNWVADGAVGEKGDIIASYYSTTVPVLGKPINPVAKQATINKVNIDADNGKITSITLDEAGVGYTTNPKVMLKDASGNSVSAEAVAILDGNEIDEIKITNPGSGFKQDANDTDHDMFDNVPLQSDASEAKSFKPGTTNVGVNFNYGTGKVQ